MRSVIVAVITSVGACLGGYFGHTPLAVMSGALGSLAIWLVLEGAYIQLCWHFNLPNFLTYPCYLDYKARVKKVTETITPLLQFTITVYVDLSMDRDYKKHGLLFVRKQVEAIPTKLLSTIDEIFPRAKNENNSDKTDDVG